MSKNTPILLGILACVLAACSTGGLLDPVPTPQLQTPIPVPTHTFTPSPIPPPTETPLASNTPILTATPLIGSTSTPLPPPTPFGCAERPIDDMRRVPIREWELNQRTLAMLVYAQSIYDGPNDLILSITQGSYNPGVDASFGTHDGGGVVDVSIYNQGPDAGMLDVEEIEMLVQALRGAGFAAWHRQIGDLYPGSPPHIHAVAIADPELSPAAMEQLSGPNGYFRGRNGLPGNRGGPDPHGGPALCSWMEELGYRDLRAE